MERYALLRHLQQQRQLVQRVIPNQRLDVYVAQHRLLPATIGTLPEPSMPAAQIWHAATQGESKFTVGETIPAQIERDEAKQDTRQPEQRGAELAQPNQEMVARKLDEPATTEARTSELSHTASEKYERPANQQLQANLRRSRIEERPQPTSYASSTYPLPASNAMRQKAADVQRGRQAEQKTKEQIQAESEAAALFTSSTTERTPQEWLAFLMQAERKPQANEKIQDTPQQRIESHAASFSSAVPPEFTAQGNQARSVARPNHTAQTSQAFQTARPVTYPGNAQQITSRSLDTRVQATMLRPEGKGASQFVPARQIAGEQNREDVSEAEKDIDQGSEVEPISLRARQMLKPLVGFDPAEARIHRGPTAARFVSTQRADAVTVGDDIYLAAEQANDEPETLGILAHELTHVARHHEPRAVPPVLSNQQNPARIVQEADAARDNKASAASDETFATADEEMLAEQVERQVTQRARSAKNTGMGPHNPANATPAFGAQQSSQQEHYSWGRLPAPWEPLPDWLAASSSTATGEPEALTNPAQPWETQPMSFEHHSSQQYGAGAPSTPSNTGSAHSASAGNAQNAAPAAQRAGKERTRSTAEEQPSWQEPPMQQHKPEPDLDKLARQVYAVLKRKLEVERRRMN